MRRVLAGLLLGLLLTLAAAPALADPGFPGDDCTPSATDPGTLDCGSDELDDGGLSPGDDVGQVFAVVAVLVVVLGVCGVIVKVSLARGMARRSGMDETEATAMTLLSDDGLDATYLASNLRPTQPAAPTQRPVAERLAELDGLRSQGLVTEAEYAERRAAILASL
ncbi:SHOCT domain-containing protein [Nocardioides anomalus]|uniref:SHOCT domain-containing protein n=1 Tax=Nocardioides anomalus TaxID=2712223 RepID=A0A6G6WFE9_9ACTN|nr:SHOCT domain-containing protein [Nocardioides anomalus]QIG43770.1 SHOCT domain-containing protein [Nocardioides anomalus]